MSERPPAPPIPRSTLKADLVVKTLWGYRRNTFYFISDTAPAGITDLEVCANKIKDTYAPVLKVLMSDVASIERVEARWYGAGTSGWEANSTTSPVAGTFVSPTPASEDGEMGAAIEDTLPDEVSLIVQKRTGNTGRAAYGRWFFTGLAEQIQNAGIIIELQRPTVRALANKLSEDIAVTGTFATTLHARHWNKKLNILMPITKCYAVVTMGTRRDRRRPLQLERV